MTGIRGRKGALTGALILVLGGLLWIAVTGVLQSRVLPLLDRAGFKADRISINPLDGNICLHSLAFDNPSKGLVLTVPEIRLDLAVFGSLKAGRVIFERMTLTQPDLNLLVPLEGLDFDGLRSALSSDAEGANWISISGFQIDQGIIRASSTALNAPVFEGIDLALRVDERSNTVTDFAFKARISDDQGSVSAQGHLVDPEGQYAGDFSVVNLALSALEHGWQKPLSLRGRLEGSGTFEGALDGAGPLVVTGTQWQGTALSLRSSPSGDDWLMLGGLTVDEWQLDLPAHRFTLQGVVATRSVFDARAFDLNEGEAFGEAPWDVDIKDLNFQVLQLASAETELMLNELGISELKTDRAARGSLSVDELSLEEGRLLIRNVSRAPVLEDQTVLSSTPFGSAAKGVALRIGHVAARALALEMEGDQEGTVESFGLEDVSFTVEGLDLGRNTDALFQCQSTLKTGGQLSLEGALNLHNQGIDAAFRIEAVDLARLLQGRIPEALGASIEGVLDLQGRLRSEGRWEALGVESARGALRALKLQPDRLWDGSLYAETLQIDGLSGRLSPPSVMLESLHFEAPWVKLNLGPGQPSEASAATQKQALPSSFGPARIPPALPTLPWVIHRLTVGSGRLDYRDSRLLWPYEARIHRLQGGISGLSSSPLAQPKVKLRGVIDPFGSLLIEGATNPLKPGAPSDLQFHFENVRLRPWSPLTATFAGRTIDSGILDLDVSYRRQDPNIDSQYRLTLRDLHLGERVNSPRALDLPLDLVVALLEEPDGTLRFSLPVEGNAEGSEVGYGSLFLQALQRSLSGLVLRPFEAMAATWSDADAPDLGVIPFEAGHSFLLPLARERLIRLAAHLRDRPPLRLRIFPSSHALADADALRKHQARLEIERRLKRVSRPEAVEVPLDLSDERVARVIQEWADDLGLEETRAALKSAPAQLLEAIEKRQRLNANALLVLGEARAEMIQRVLINELRLAPDRVVRMTALHPADPLDERKVGVSLELFIP